MSEPRVAAKEPVSQVEPLLSDIEFDHEGSTVLGFEDRATEDTK